MKSTITRAKDGVSEREVSIEDIHIPDLWHIAMSLPEEQQKAVLETWHLCHDLRRHVEECLKHSLPENQN